MERTSSRTIGFVILAIVVFLYAVQRILLPFVLAGAVAYVCTPMLNWLAARTHFPRALFGIAVFVILLALAAGLLLLAAPPLFREVMEIVSNLRGTIEALVRGAIGSGSVTVLGRSMNAAQAADWGVGIAQEWIAHADTITMLAGWSSLMIFGLFLTLVLLFYFLVSGPSIGRGLLWLAPPRRRALVEHVWSRLDPVLWRYFIGVIAVVAYAVTAAYTGLYFVLGIRHAAALAVLTGLLEMLPVIGPGAAAVIAGLVAVHYATGLADIIAYALYAAALRLSIDQILGPVILGSAARLHPALIIFCFLAGGLLFGIAGIIMAVPVALTIRTVLATIYDESTIETIKARSA